MRSGKNCILIADDEKEIRDILKQTPQMLLHGFLVYSVSDTLNIIFLQPNLPAVQTRSGAFLPDNSLLHA